MIVRTIVPRSPFKDSNMNDGKPSKIPAPMRAPSPPKARFPAVMCPLNNQPLLPDKQTPQEDAPGPHRTGGGQARGPEFLCSFEYHVTICHRHLIFWWLVSPVVNAIDICQRLLHWLAEHLLTLGPWDIFWDVPSVCVILDLAEVMPSWTLEV